MVTSRFLIGLVLTSAVLAFGGSASIMAAESEVVVANSRPAPLPSQAEIDAVQKARADNSAKVLTTDEQVAAWVADAPKIKRSAPAYNDDALWPDQADAARPRQPHGEVSVSVGTNGYRSAYATSYIPVGERGTLGIAIAKTDFGDNGYYDYGYGGGYGGGYYDSGYGYDRHGRTGSRRGGSSQSIGLSLDMTGTGKNQPSVPEGCAPGFRDGDRYIEPLWVTRMNGDRQCTANREP